MNNKAFFNISYGLYVLITKNENVANGCIVNTLMQQTNNPQKVSVTVNKLNYTHDLLLESGKFNISLIDTTADFELFKHYGFSSGRDTDKITGYSGIKTAENGIPYQYDSSNAYFSCSVTDTVDLGSHTLFVASVDFCDVLSSEQSVTYDFYQKNIKPVPAASHGKGWQCTICNYISDLEVLPDDFVCPVCKHGKPDFKKI